MNTLYFKYAVEVERTHSITRAASNLYMAQPNLSKAIKELEDTLGITIFERTPKGVIPTLKGKEFLEYAKKILIQMEKMESLKLSKNRVCQSFNVAVPGSCYISSCISEFISELDVSQDIDINVERMNSVDMINSVSDGKYNLGIIHYPLEYENYFTDFLKDKNLKSEVIWTFEHLLLMSRNNPVSEKEKISEQDIENLIEIMHDDIYVPYINGITKKNISSKRIVIHEKISQFEILCNIPQSFMWASPVPEYILEHYNLIHRKCSHLSSKCRDMIIFPEGYKFTDIDRKFADKIYSSKNKVSFVEYI
ncbi:MAG: LysR family transcriptional regulator [Oscillospiraceae bacterium]|nr:LysR family transcriptional regulator [Oscillospiraceae bacterium]